jgi:hypothetical protein
MSKSTDEFRLETHAAIEAITRALTIAKRGVGRGDVTAKGGRDLVTATDITVEDAVNQRPPKPSQRRPTFSLRRVKLPWTVGVGWREDETHE